MNEDKQVKKDRPIKSSQRVIDELKKEVELWQNKYLRALADYQNLERRVTEQLVDQKKKADKNLILKFLDVLDDLEKGELFVSDSGLKLIKEKFVKILKDCGVKEIEVLGELFDPHVSECIAVIPGDRNDVIVKVLRKGYRLNGEVIRAARVNVEKKL